MKTIINHHGVDVYVQVSPCSWMYPGYGLQVQLALEADAVVNASTVILNDKALPVSLEGAVELATRHLCLHGLTQLHEAVAKHAITVAKLRAEVDAIHAKEAKKLVAREAKLRTQGFTHKVDAWIHPTHGDDYQATVYFKGEPSHSDVAKALKASVVKTDYRVVAL